MSKFMIASEENIEHLEHYGVKGMKWGKRTVGFRKGSNNGAEYGAGLNTKSIGVKPIMVKSGTDDDKYRQSVEARIKAHRAKENEAKEKAAGGRKVSQEYLDDRAYNSKTNIYFGNKSNSQSKTMANRSTSKSGSPTVYTKDSNGKIVKVGESIKGGAARGGLTGNIKDKPKQTTGKPIYGYATRDENGQLQYYSSKGEQHAANEKRKQAKKEKIKSKFKNLGERIKNTAKGLKK